MQPHAANSSIETLPRRSKLGPLVMALLIQVGLLFFALFIVVLVPEFESEPEFVARKKIYLPQKELQHKVALAEFQNASSSLMQFERISTQALLPDSMPALTNIPKSEFRLIERNPAALHSDSLLGQSGVLSALQGLQTASSSASFFGVEDAGQRILILFDNSVSVWNKASQVGVTTDRFVQELSTLIDSLSANTQFALVPFSRKIGTFRDYMIAGGSRNKRAAKSWITEKVRTQQLTTQLPHDIDGVQGALAVAFQMEPDVIFMISDADFQRNRPTKGDVPWAELWRTLQILTREYGIEPRIHFIGFQVKEDAANEMKKITRRYKGEWQEF